MTTSIDQKSKGRFPRPLNNHLYNIEGWMQRNKVVGTDNKAMLIMAFAFLAVCLVNTVGLLLAKFLNAAPIAGVRRALGASRRDIFWQHLTESGVIAVAGGIAGGLLGVARRLGAACLVWALRAGPRARRCQPTTALRDRGGHLARRGNHRRPVSGLAYRARGARLLPEGAIAMGLRPIFSALMRNSAGAILVAIQIALTLAIVVNAVFVTSQRVTKIGRPIGNGRPEQFAVPVTGFEKNYDFFAMVRADMAMLRDMPGVIDAAPTTRFRCRVAAARRSSIHCPTRRARNRRWRTTTPTITP